MIFLIRVFVLVLCIFISGHALAETWYDEPAWVYKARGDRLREQGELGQAIAQYRKALIKQRIDGDADTFPEVHLELAQIYREQKLYDLALQHIQSAENQREFLLISDLVYRILYTRAAIYEDLNRLDQVLKVCLRIVEEDPNYKDDNRRFFFNRTLSELPGRYIGEFRDNKELGAKFGPAYSRIGSIKFRNGSYETAEPYLRMAFLYGTNGKTTRYLLEYYRMRGLREEYELVRRYAE
jgi:tetratricopeptide (TPR) repeat protein